MKKRNHNTRLPSGLSVTAFILALLTVWAVLSGCRGPETVPGGDTDAEKSGEESVPVNVSVLSGSTGFGSALMMESARRGETAGTACRFTVETDPALITASLISGATDIAALPTNAAANLFNKKPDSIVILAVNTLGVLYLVSDESQAVRTPEDLKGERVYCPAQNPTYIFSAVCRAGGLIPGEDIIIDNTYAQPAEVRAALLSGEISLAVLPEPMVTVVLNAVPGLEASLDVSRMWSDSFDGAGLPQGCLVARKAFVEAYPNAVRAFMDDYRASVESTVKNPASAADAIVAAGLINRPELVPDCVGRCNLCVITGQEMADMLNGFYRILYGESPVSVGGKVPDPSLYYDFND